jgi:hypothetical protein
MPRQFRQLALRIWARLGEPASLGRPADGKVRQAVAVFIARMTLACKRRLAPVSGGSPSPADTGGKRRRMHEGAGP